MNDVLPIAPAILAYRSPRHPTAEGNCAGVYAIGRGVERTAPEMAIAFTSDPGIARCY